MDGYLLNYCLGIYVMKRVWWFLLKFPQIFVMYGLLTQMTVMFWISQKNNRWSDLWKVVVFGLKRKLMQNSEELVELWVSVTVTSAITLWHAQSLKCKKWKCLTTVLFIRSVIRLKIMCLTFFQPCCANYYTMLWCASTVFFSAVQWRGKRIPQKAQPECNSCAFTGNLIWFGY